MNSRKQVLIGLFLGIVAVFALAVGMFIMRFENVTVSDFFNFNAYHKVVSLLLSLSLLLNLALFFLFIKMNKDYFARGILTSTMLIGILIFVLKFW
jgi:hypothetical protein